MRASSASSRARCSLSACRFAASTLLRCSLRGRPSLLVGLRFEAAGRRVVLADGLREVSGGVLGDPLVALRDEPVEGLKLRLNSVSRVGEDELRGGRLGDAAFDQLPLVLGRLRVHERTVSSSGSSRAKLEVGLRLRVMVQSFGPTLV